MKDTFVKAGEFGAAAVKETADFLILDDVKTVMDPKASTMDKVISGASIIPAGKVLKVVKYGKGAFEFSNKGKHTAKRVNKPYSNPKNRPKYGKGQVEKVWGDAQDIDGKVYDPNTGEELFWNKSKTRAGQWDMAHTPENKYSKWT
ncbi:GH-E family nuclease [Cerasibacillus sp. JNUCC 74]